MPLTHRVLYPCHHFVAAQNGRVITLASFFRDAFHTDCARYWLAKAIEENPESDLIMLEQGDLEIWLLPRIRSQGVAIKATINVLRSDWTPLDLDASTDGVALQYAWVESDSIAVDRVAFKDWPSYIRAQFPEG